MVRSITLTLALIALPALAGAEEMYRWRDASGGLHYGNVAGRVPADAQVVTSTIGHLAMPPGGDIQPVAARAATEAPPPGRSGAATRARGCCAFGGSYTVVLNNPHELADQVKQASLLDALGISWRHGCCP